MQPGHIHDLFKHTQIEDQKEVYKCRNTVLNSHDRHHHFKLLHKTIITFQPSIFM